MTQTLLKNHRGTDIFVDEDGYFSARVGETASRRGRDVRRKELRAVEREIEQVLPRGTTWLGIDVFTPFGDQAEGPVTTCRIVGIRREKRRGWVSTVMIDADGHDRGHYYEELHRFDPAIVARLNEIQVALRDLIDEKKQFLARTEKVKVDDVVRMIDAWEAGTRPPDAGQVTPARGENA